MKVIPSLRVSSKAGGECFMEELSALIGANLTCELWVENEREFHVVPKLEVAQMLEGKGSFSGWRDAAEHVWPGANLLYSGRTDLGITATPTGSD